MKVLLIADTPNWAWMFKAKAIQKYLNDRYEKISVIYLKQFHKGLMAKYHTVHFFGWMDRRKIAGKYKGLTAGVSSHNFEYLHPEKAKKYLPRYSAITGNSMLIYNKLKQMNLNSNIYYTPNGVDETVFYPKPIKHNRLTIGWIGQPSGEGLNKSSSLDMHGYHNVLLPLVEALEWNQNIEFKIMAKTHKNAMKFEKMPEFYNSLDLYLHTGFGTGTPNTAFEAMACGVPVLSIAIGALPEIIQEGVNGWLVSRYYNKEDAKDRVKQLYNILIQLNFSRLSGMREQTRTIIEQEWTWKKRAEAWIPVFENHWKKI